MKRQNILSTKDTCNRLYIDVLGVPLYPVSIKLIEKSMSQIIIILSTFLQSPEKKNLAIDLNIETHFCDL